MSTNAATRDEERTDYLNFTEIGNELGVSRQHAAYLVRKAGLPIYRDQHNAKNRLVKREDAAILFNDRYTLVS